MPKVPKLKVFCQSQKNAQGRIITVFMIIFCQNGTHRPLMNTTERSDTSNIGILGILLVDIEILRLSFNGPGNRGYTVV